uniref:Amyloid beta precursor protein binding family A member 2 n=1 Tax=Pygocentrus nattereri TaxID=42514 RepID=A0AAR2KYY3_PYGNA
MALRRGQALEASVTEPDPPPAPEQSEKHSRDREDSEKPPSSPMKSQSSTPIPDSLCPSDGSVSGEDSIRGDSPIQPDSMEDSLSEYDNVGSEEEEEQDYEEDEELRTDADGMTYYVHCCPEDESYMEGMDCHEGAESSDRPSTSREPDGGQMPVEVWAQTEGFYEVLQQGKEQLVYKRSEPITETTFIQAPMAEDEEDDEEEAEEVEDDEEEEEEEEEDENYFLLSDRNPSKSVRMMQAQEAVDRVKCLDGECQSLTEVDLFISTKAIKVLNADTQETMMDNALRTISYIADIGSVVVLMARRRMSHSASLDCTDTGLNATEGRKQYRMICYVFESEDAQLIAQSIGQAFSMAYQEFLRANGINPKDLSQKDYSDILNTQEMYNDDLIHFSNSENCKELHLEKQKGEILGVVIVESGWGSILPTVILACMLNSGPAARSGKLNVGDQIMAVNDTSLVGLPLATCQGIIKGLKSQVQVKLSVVSCPPVTTVLIKRPDLQYQLGFSVQNGIICSLMRGGIAERGGVRVGHRIIEINGQSVVAMAHEKIVHALSVSVGEIHMKTMPAVMFRLLTGQETPTYI